MAEKTCVQKSLNSAAIVPVTTRLASEVGALLRLTKYKYIWVACMQRVSRKHQSHRILPQPTSSPSNRATLDYAARQVSLLVAFKWRDSSLSRHDRVATRIVKTPVASLRSVGTVISSHSSWSQYFAAAERAVKFHCISVGYRCSTLPRLSNRFRSTVPSRHNPRK